MQHQQLCTVLFLLVIVFSAINSCSSSSSTTTIPNDNNGENHTIRTIQGISTTPYIEIVPTRAPYAFVASSSFGDASPPIQALRGGGRKMHQPEAMSHGSPIPIAPSWPLLNASVAVHQALYTSELGVVFLAGKSLFAGEGTEFMLLPDITLPGNEQGRLVVDVNDSIIAYVTTGEVYRIHYHRIHNICV